MAEFNEGVSVLGRQQLLKQKTINDVAYFRILGQPPLPKRRLGTLNLCVDFGESSGSLFYLVQEVRVWNQSLAWYPPFESRLGVQWTLFVDWKVQGIAWNLNTF